MKGTISINEEIIRQLILLKLDPAGAEKELKSKGFAQEEIAAYLKEFDKTRRKNRQGKGFVLTALGAFLGFLSCILTILNPVPQLYYVILYGVTFFAICILCLGLYFIFE